MSHYATVLRGVLATTAIVLLIGTAHAADIDCTAGLTKSSDFTLQDNYYCTSSCTCFTLTNGADLGLNGHTITCRATTGSTCGTAISANGSAGSRIWGCGVAGPCSANQGGTITSDLGKKPWTYGVYFGDQVSYVTFQGMTSYGTYKVPNVFGSVFQNIYVAIYTNGATGSLVQNNFIDGNVPSVFGTPGTIGITVSPSVGPTTVDRNTMRGYSFAGLNLINSPYTVTVTNNIINAANPSYPTAVPIRQTPSVTASLQYNLCSDLTKCPIPEHFFVLP
ncbi:MAG TPA: hypothetical protein VMU34_04125 [Mycobacterium sp.]|nr:hypothetical protein [Mycobacterium sp.]